MNCPNCQHDNSEIIGTAKHPESDRRRHRCLHCTARWTTIAALEPGSLVVPTNNPQPPPLIAICPQRGSDLSSKEDLSEKRSDLSKKEEKKGAAFDGLVTVFCARWQRSYKRPYPITPGDRSQLGRFMREQGHYIESFAQICDRYLSDRRQFVIDRSNGHTLKWLVTSGLAMYGGTPRESAEQFAARTRKEHEAMKRQGPTRSRELRELVLDLADQKAVR